MIPLTDLQAQHRALEPEISRVVVETLASQELILGPRVASFERELGAFLHASAVVGVSSGTDALLLALLDAGIGPGDEVITPAFTFVATAEVVARVGARPVFVDVRSDSLCIDIDAVRSAITTRTRAVLAVHLFGHPADVVELRALCDERDLVLIEDCAQSFGARLDGRALGTFGHYGAFSFFPSKILGGAGDGGALVADAARAARVRSLRNHGSVDKESFERIGGNFRLDAIQAAILSVKLRHAESFLAARARAVTSYRDAFRDALTRTPELENAVVLPMEREGTAAWNYFFVRARDRDGLSEALRLAGIGSAAYYRRPLHLQPCFASLGMREGALPCTEAASRNGLALPLYPELSAAQIDEIVGAVERHYRGER